MEHLCRHTSKETWGEKKRHNTTTGGSTTRIVITGASRGIGLATARQLLTEELHLISRTRDIPLQAYNIHTYKADLSCRREAERVVSRIARNGQIDALINNAGATADRTLKKMTDEEWETALRNNLYSTFYVTRAMLPHIRDNGCIINISSVTALKGNFGQSNYAAAKAGIIAFTKSLAREVAPRGIRVIAIAPGFIDTDMLKTIPQTYLEQIRENIPLGRFGQPEEVARLIRFLVTEDSYITGTTIVIDGGYTNA